MTASELLTTPDSLGAGRASAEGEGMTANGAIPLLGYACLCLNLLFFGYLFVADPQTYFEIRREDRWMEYLTAVWFLLAGLLLFAAALCDRSLFRRCAYVLGGIVMVFIAGEEISWGQRIFDFETPDFLLRVNGPGEFNVHNIDAPLTGDLFRYVALMLCAVTAAAFFRRKDALMGFPLPSLLTMFGFLIAMAYAPSADPNEVRSPFHLFDLTVNFSNGRILLFLFCFYFLLSRQVQWFAISAATVTIVLVFLYVHAPSPVYHGVGREIEVQEYLFGLVCIFYALELLGRRRAVSVSWMPLASIQMRVARSSLWRRLRSRSERAQDDSTPPPPPKFLGSNPAGVYISSLVIVCSLGLALASSLSTRAAILDAEDVYRSIASGAYGEPAGRSTWDVYLVENRLVYFKEPCSTADRALFFRLRLYPVDEDDLPDGDRRRYGFHHLDFKFGARGLGAILNGVCVRTFTLPDYAIERIVTGQVVYGQGPRWEVQFSPP